MKNFFPFKFLVIAYSFLLLIPLSFIFWLPNNSINIVVKTLLGLWLIYIVIHALQKYSAITLGPYLCFTGLFFILFRFTWSSFFGFFAFLLLILPFCAKFSQIDKLYADGKWVIIADNIAILMNSFIFKLIHRITIQNDKKGLKNLTKKYSFLGQKQLSDILVVGIWTMVGMKLEGFFKYPDGSPNILPFSLDIYGIGNPFTMEVFKKILKIFQRNSSSVEASAILIWIYTSKGLFYEPEMNKELNDLWQLLMTTRDFWEKSLIKFYNQDKDNVAIELLNNALDSSRIILNNLPPETFNLSKK